MLIWQAHKGKIESAAFSPDGRLLATATGGTRTVYLWDPTTGTLVRRLAGNWPSGPRLGAIKSVAFAKDAPLFAAGTSRSVSLWRTDSWELVADLGHGHAYELAFGPGESPQLAASNSGWIALWNNAGRPTRGRSRPPDRRLHDWGARGITVLDFSRDGQLLATSTRDAAIVWNASTGKRIRSIRTEASANRGAVRFSPDGSRIASAHGKWVDVVARQSLEPAPAEVPSERVRPSLLQVFRQTLSSALRRWQDVTNPEPDPEPLLKIRAGTGRSPIVWAVAWTGDGHSILTAGNDGLVRLWDAGTGEERRTYNWQIGKLYCAAFSPDGLTCAACGARGQVVVWDVDE